MPTERFLGEMDGTSPKDLQDPNGESGCKLQVKHFMDLFGNSKPKGAALCNVEYLTKPWGWQWTEHR